MIETREKDMSKMYRLQAMYRRTQADLDYAVASGQTANVARLTRQLDRLAGKLER